MFLRIENIPSKKLIGKQLRMSLVNNKTGQLWASFMPHRNEIVDRVSQDLISMQIYDPGYSFENFNPSAEFTKWAAIEVDASGNSTIPDGLETITVPGGQYAVFLHKGPASEGERSFRYIFGEWLPQSGYQLDQRPHFELLGARYKNNAADSEEEIWIPVKM